MTLDVVKAALTKDDGSGRLGGPDPTVSGVIRNYAITNTLDSRRRRNVLAVGVVEFDVYLSLGAYGYATFNEYFAVAQHDLGGAMGAAGLAVRSEISMDWSATCLCTVTVLAATVAPNQNYPSLEPTFNPSPLPTYKPTLFPTYKPTITFGPTSGTPFPTLHPTPLPGRNPTSHPTASDGKTEKTASLSVELMIVAALIGFCFFSFAVHTAFKRQWITKDGNNAINDTNNEVESEDALISHLAAMEEDITTMKSLDKDEASSLKPGGVAEFLREKAGISSERSVALAQSFAQDGYRIASDFQGLSEEDMTDYLLQTEVGMLEPEIRTFRRAVAAPDEEGRVDEEEGIPGKRDPISLAAESFKEREPITTEQQSEVMMAPSASDEDKSCMQLLRKFGLDDVNIDEIKARVGSEKLTFNNLNSDLISDEMLENFGFRKTKVRMFRHSSAQVAAEYKNTRMLAVPEELLNEILTTTEPEKISAVEASHVGDDDDLLARVARPVERAGGNIRVAVRVRPPNARELAGSGSEVCVVVSPEDCIVQLVEAAAFTFDVAFPHQLLPIQRIQRDRHGLSAAGVVGVQRIPVRLWSDVVGKDTLNDGSAWRRDQLWADSSHL